MSAKVLICLMLVAASRTVPVDDEKMSRTFDRRIRELEDVIEHLTKATDRKMFNRNLVQSLEDEWDDNEDHVQGQLSASLNKIAELEERIRRLDGKKDMPRSCHEIHSQEPSKASGHYWVDPDGPNTGDDPVPVYCNMAEGSTLISHDKAEPGELTGCIGEGCQQQRFHYYATTNQLTALVQRSEKCSQDFEFVFDCNNKVFELAESSWLDRFNNTQRFSNCHLLAKDDDQCHWSCKLQSGNLPITKLSLGRKSYAVHNFNGVLTLTPGHFMLGKMECSGHHSPAVQTVTEAPKPEVELPSVVDAPLSKTCPRTIGWDSSCHQIETGCYCLVEDKLTWDAAEKRCKAKGMHLVSIETAGEEGHLHDLISNYGFNYEYWWTSGSDRNEEGKWLWTSSGKEFTFNNWGHHQPNGGNEQNYLQLERRVPLFGKAGTFFWNDFPAFDREYFICEH